MDCLLAQAALVVTLSVRLLGIELAVERDGRVHDLIGPVTIICSETNTDGSSKRPDPPPDGPGLGATRCSGRSAERAGRAR